MDLYRVEGRVLNAKEARRQMMMWATGQRSHANHIRGPHDTLAVGTEAALAVADSAETQRWAAVYVALRGED